MSEGDEEVGDHRAIEILDHKLTLNERAEDDVKRLAAPSSKSGRNEGVAVDVARMQSDAAVGIE